MTTPVPAGAATPGPRSIRLVVTDEVAAAFPGLRIGVLVARGVDNHHCPPAVDEAFTDAVGALAAGGEDVLDHPHLVAWREAHRAFGSNPRRFRPSVDALARRVVQRGDLPRINPVVDAYNAVSLRHLLPAGCYDLARVRGDVRLRLATAGEPFRPLGSPVPDEETFAGEVVYADDAGVLTRRWNHRDGDVAKVTAETRDAVVLVESAGGGVLPQAVEVALVQADTLLRALGADTRPAILDADARTVEL